MTRHCAPAIREYPCRWPRLAPRSFGWYWICVAGQEPQDQQFGHITAVDADSGTVLWNDNSDAPMLASAMPAAGEVLLTGDTKGTFLAFDAATGTILLKMTRGNPSSSMVISMLDGIQERRGGEWHANPVIATESGPAWAAILALPGLSTLSLPTGLTAV